MRRKCRTLRVMLRRGHAAIWSRGLLLSLHAGPSHAAPSEGVSRRAILIVRALYSDAPLMRSTHQWPVTVGQHASMARNGRAGQRRWNW
jgi:hypothetical protein